MTDTDLTTFLTKALKELELYFMEYAMSCEYEILKVQSELSTLRAEDKGLKRSNTQ